MTVTVRPAVPTDLPLLFDIEVAAGQAFADVGLPEVAADDGFTVAELTPPMHDGRLWVAVDDDRVVGYLLARVVGERGHVEQVSVLPDAQGRGSGRALVDQACRWAASLGYREVTLSTFRDVPWNAPLYRRLDFRDLTESEIDDALQAEREHERAAGLDVDARVFMVRTVSAS